MSNPRQPGKAEETFEDYMLNARDEFVMAVKNEERSNFLLTAIDSFLICFDQMREKLTASPLPAFSSIEGQKEETMAIAWEAWKEVYRINCTWDGNEFDGYDWSMVRLEFDTWWSQQSVIGFPVSTEPKIPVTKKSQYDTDLLCNFFTWFRNNGERYIGKSIEGLVDTYLLTTNSSAPTISKEDEQ